MWPTSPAISFVPEYSLPFRIRPAPIPVPKVRKIMFCVPPARSPFPLRHRAGIGVILQGDRDAEPVPEWCNHVNPVPSRQIGRRQHQSVRAVERTAAADTDRMQGIDAFFSHKRFQGIFQLQQSFPGPLPCWKADLCRDLQPAVIFKTENRRAFRSADVYSAKYSFHEKKKSPQA